MQSNRTVIHVDGAARGNPGPAAFAYVLAPPGESVIEHSEVMGRATNNVAEYTALVRALEKAAELGLQKLDIFSDSELIVKQMSGEYSVKSPDLQTLNQQAARLMKRFESVRLQHVRREQNKRADELCNIALDGGKPKPMPAAAAAPKASAATVSDTQVRTDAIECLRAAAAEWSNGTEKLTPEQLWEQLWSILEEGGVLRKKKKK